MNLGVVFDAGVGCGIDVSKELMITDLSVVEDRQRTGPGDPWSFGQLMTQMAGTGDPADFTENLFKRWLTPQVVNGFTVAARPGMQTLVLNGWPRVNGKLDLTRAPLRLLAISARLDLRQLSAGNAGEGRFVFGVTTSSGLSLPFTIILEYKLPAKTPAQLTQWASNWHALGALPVPSETYNATLQVITDRFAAANVKPSRPNGSAIGQIRTNENALSPLWELRQFQIDATGQLVQAPLNQNPDRSFNNTATFANWVNRNEAALLTGAATVPLNFQQAPFRAPATLNTIDFWAASGITNNEARHQASLNSCNGCHGRETGTLFLHINPRASGQPSALSGFLTGVGVIDPVSGTLRRFADLDRRAADLASLVCPTGLPDAALLESTAARGH